MIAIHDAGLKVRCIDDLGVCNNWDGYRKKAPRIIHYPAPMLDRDGERLWFKQDYTRDCRERRLAWQCRR